MPSNDTLVVYSDVEMVYNGVTSNKITISSDLTNTRIEDVLKNIVFNVSGKEVKIQNIEPILAETEQCMCTAYLDTVEDFNLYIAELDYSR